MNSPNMPGFFLALAFFCGGLRLPGAWLAFAVLFLPWFVGGREPFAPAQRPAAALFFLWLALAALFSPEPAVSWAAFSRYLLPGLAFFAAASARDGERGWLGAVLVLGAVAAAAFLFQKFSGRDVVGLIGLNPNYTAAFAAAAFPAAVLAACGKTGKKMLLWAGLAVLLAGGLLASASRGALLAAFLSAGVALASAGRKKTLALVCAAALAAFLILPESFWGGLLKFYDSRAFERPRLWRAALEIAGGHPFFGAGPGLFEKAFEIVKFPYFDGISYYGHSTAHAHCEILNLAAEAGFPAAVFFLAAAAGGLYAGAKRNLPLAACALSVLIQGSVDIVFYSGAVAILFWGSLGFLAPRGPAGGAVCKTGRAALALLCFAGLLYGAAAPFYPFGAEYRARAYAQAAAGRDPALNLALQRYSRLDRPKDPFAARRAGSAAAAAGDLARAESELRAALALEPFYSGARLELAKVYAARGGKAAGCAALKPLDMPVTGRILTDYQRGLIYFNRLELGRMKKELCVKTRTGAVTAPTLKTR